MGAETIASLSDNTKPARLCNEQYAKARDQLLAGHPWNFALTRVVLTPLSALPSGWEDNPDWDYAYNLPSDCLRVWKVDDNTSPWATESGYLLYNHSPASILYIKQVTNTALFSKSFEKVLAFDVALKVVYALTQSATLVQTLQAGRDEAIREARSFDAQENGLVAVQPDDFLFSRF
jgi:hypothetical protein